MNKVTISWDDEGVVTIKVRPSAVRTPDLDWGDADDREALTRAIREAAKPPREELWPSSPAVDAKTAAFSKEELEAKLVAAADKGFEAAGEEWQCARCRRSVFSQGFPKGWHQPHETPGKAATCNECKLIADRMLRSDTLVECGHCGAWEWERQGKWSGGDDGFGAVDTCPICNERSE